MIRRFTFLLALLVPVLTSAQQIEARLGVLGSTTLVRDEGASHSLQRALGSTVSVTELKLGAAPMASVLVTTPIAVRTVIEASLSAGLAQLRASNRSADWDAQTATIAGLGVGLRYNYWRRVWLTGGFGVTRFFSDSRGIFSEGSSLNPLIEAGAMLWLPTSIPIHVAARLQTHTFGTPALRREGATDGKPTRFLIQLGVGR